MRTDSGNLDAECHVFSRYLFGIRPNEYVLGKYRSAHEADILSQGDRFGVFLLRFGSKSPLMARLADSYSRLCLPNTLLRRKLVLLLAILETAAPSSHRIEPDTARTPAQVIVRLALAGLSFSVSGPAAIVLLAPFHLAMSLTREPAK